MNVDDLLVQLRRRPFIPFRLVTTDGTTYEVRHLDFVMPGRGSAVIGYPDERKPGIVSHFDIVSYLHVTRLEFESADAPAVRQ
jgi:hypothetical protein